MDAERQKLPAYLTVYLALVMSILLSLCLALIEGARSNAIRLEAECVVDIAMNSVLAEYHRELFEQYNLFAIDSSYGTPYSGKINTQRHLQAYIERNLSMEDIFLSDFLYKDFLAMSVDQERGVDITKVSVFTDYEGTVFRRMAVDAVKDDVGVTLLDNILNWTDTVTSYGLQEKDMEAQMQEIDDQIQSFDGTEVQIAENEWIAVDVVNPAEEINKMRRKGILQTVIYDPEKLSGKGIAMNHLFSERKKQGALSCGNVAVEHLSTEEELLERFLFQEYLLRYMSRYGQQEQGKALDYQIEYLLTGKNNDIDNLRSVANKLCLLREAANAIYLFSNEEKSMEAEVAAAVLATLLMVPELTDLFKSALLLGWAYAESLYDVKMLLSGGKIPLIKNDATWHYDLDGALSLGTDSQEQISETGLSYEDYLRIFMMFTDLNS